ncbi:MAG: cellulase family glycosylhydrolase [Anaerolineae bacterium]
MVDGNEGREPGRPDLLISVVVGVFLLSLGLAGVIGSGASWPLWHGEPTLAPTPTSWPLDRHLNSPEYGVNVHMWWDPWAAVRRDWALIEEAGFTWIKQRVAWQDVEGAGPGQYDWTILDRIVDEAEQSGVEVLLRLDHPPAWAVLEQETDAASDDPSPTIPFSLDAFERFCSAIATRYQGRVGGYQIWNEPNLAREWEGRVPDPAGYVDVLARCYAAIKSADSDALVISAGLAPTGSSPPEAVPDIDYLVGMYEAGAAPYFDLLGLNAPGYKAPPEVAPEEVADPESGYGGHAFFCFRHVEEMRATMERYGDGDKQVAILEFGWHTNNSPEHPDYAWFAVTPEEQAAYLVRAYTYAGEHWAPWIGPMFVWNFPDPKWKPQDEEFWWAIVDPFWWGREGDLGSWPGGDVRPAYEALKAMPKP